MPSWSGTSWCWEPERMNEWTNRSTRPRPFSFKTLSTRHELKHQGKHQMNWQLVKCNREFFLLSSCFIPKWIFISEGFIPLICDLLSGCYFVQLPCCGSPNSLFAAPISSSRSKAIFSFLFRNFIELHTYTSIDHGNYCMSVERCITRGWGEALRLAEANGANRGPSTSVQCSTLLL